MPDHHLTRRSFLRQSLAFSALASGLVPARAFAAPADPHARHLILWGDWGYTDATGQRSVASAMTTYIAANGLKPEAAWMLGDSWYGPLPGGLDDPRWTTQYESMYPRSTFDCPMYSIMGNHDYQRMAGVEKRQVELDYARKPGTRWTQPALWYTFNYPRQNPLIKIIALDSNVPMGRRDDGVNFTLTPAEKAEQLAWFTAEIARPRTAPFLVVIAHHPIYSDGPHGDHKTLIADWEPLLRQHKAHLYLAGHDHDLQHLEFEGHPTSFVSSGAGGADLYDLKITEEARGPFANKVYGFTHMEVLPHALTLKHVTETGAVIHAFRKHPDNSIQILT